MKLGNLETMKLRNHETANGYRCQGWPVPPIYQSASSERPEVPVPKGVGKWPLCTQSAHLAPLIGKRLVRAMNYRLISELCSLPIS